MAKPVPGRHRRSKVMLPADLLFSAPHAHLIPTAESFELVYNDSGDPELTVSELAGGANYCEYPRRITQTHFTNRAEVWVMLMTYQFMEAMLLAEEEQQRPAVTGRRKSFPTKPKFYAHLTDDEWMARCFMVGYIEIISASPLYFQRRSLKGKDKVSGFAALKRVLDRYVFSKERKPLNFLISWDSVFELKWINALYKDRCIAHFVRQNNMKLIPSKWGDVAKRVEKAADSFSLSEKAIYEALERDREWHPAFHYEVT
jgi:hypothetical protein